MKRLYFSIVLTVISSLVLLGWVLDQVFQATASEHVASEFKQYVQLTHGIQQQLKDVEQAAVELKLQQLAADFSVQLSLELRDNLALPTELSSQLNAGKGILLDSEQGSYVLQQIGDSSRVLQLQLPVHAQYQDRKLELVLTLLLYLGVCIAIGIWLLPLTRRITLLSDTADRFGKGDLEQRVPENRFSYIHDLELSFNAMANQVDDLLLENKLLADGLSHDLRTPLSCLRFGIDALFSTDDKVKQQGYLDRMESELSHIENMIGAYLDYAQIERAKYQLERQPVHFYQLLQSLQQQLEPLAEQQGKVIEIEGPEKELQVVLDGHWMYRALMNLMNNAINYADKTVSVRSLVKASSLMVLIEDDGVGIPPDQIEQIFKPFVRLEKCRARNNTGFGLGLAIVAKVVEWHGGMICVESSRNLGGACFKIELPLN